MESTTTPEQDLKKNMEEEPQDAEQEWAINKDCHPYMKKNESTTAPDEKEQKKIEDKMKKDEEEPEEEDDEEMANG